MCEDCFKQFSSVNAFNQHKVFECEKRLTSCTLTSVETVGQMTTSTPITTELNEADKIRTLSNDIECTINQVQHETLETGLGELKFGVEEIKDSSPTSSLNQNSSSEHPAITDENTDDTQCISYDGTCVWRIANFKEKRST